jgi:hypothetical protein
MDDSTDTVIYVFHCTQIHIRVPDSSGEESDEDVIRYKEPRNVVSAPGGVLIRYLTSTESSVYVVQLAALDKIVGGYHYSLPSPARLFMS